MKESAARQPILRKDYSPPGYLVESVDLHFSIDAERTVVKSRLALNKNPVRRDIDSIDLDGDDLELLTLKLDGEALPEDAYTLAEDGLRIHRAPESCVIEVRAVNHPAANTALEGLYQSGDFLLTQCEAEGFRKITYFPDRPDVMAKYRVTIEADKQRYPVLLSNGNPVGQGELDAGRHWVCWEDPFPKPSYLFALVAGDLHFVEDRFNTASGREVLLRVYVEKENLDRCQHAMNALKLAMRWDEERYGLEYDLDIYNIVATNDFNMGAMENKGLNIFNSKYVLARPDTATDADYQAIESVIGHEYFHNWTGNRVTCRDWFQLTLKEGLTVYRDQEFSCDMQSRAVKRIQDARDLKRLQFPEDAGPMSHPIRPERYIEINNFYTVTVYEKGAEVIRMYETLLGRDGFRRGMDEYFARHDGQAVTCDDFLAAMADANRRDLSQFGRWYSRSGTPEIDVSAHHDPQTRTYRLRLTQRSGPDGGQSEPLHVPFAVGLLAQDGTELPLSSAVSAAAVAETSNTRILELREAVQEFQFNGIEQAPVPSLLRGFSAPVKVNFEYSPDQLALLMAHDRDPYARCEAGQRLAEMLLLETIKTIQAGREPSLDDKVRDAFHHVLQQPDLDPALAAEILRLPAETLIADAMEVVDVDAIHRARHFVQQGLGQALEPLWQQRYQDLSNEGDYSAAPAAIARRSLRNLCLAYLASGGSGGHELVRRQYTDSGNMTDTLVALTLLVHHDIEGAVPALEAFESRWKGDALVMNKWFAIQAQRPDPEAYRQVRALADHPEFTIKNPNKVRSLFEVFAASNPIGFHRADGRGYRLIADQVLVLNGLNPQVAARIASTFNRWKRYDGKRQAAMRAELQRISATENLSPDVYEIVSNALK